VSTTRTLRPDLVLPPEQPLFADYGAPWRAGTPPSDAPAGGGPPTTSPARRNGSSDGVVGLLHRGTLQWLADQATSGEALELLGVDAPPPPAAASLCVGCVHDAYRDHVVWSEPALPPITHAESGASKLWTNWTFPVYAPSVCGAPIAGAFAAAWTVEIDTASACLQLPPQLYDAAMAWLPANNCPSVQTADVEGWLGHNGRKGALRSPLAFACSVPADAVNAWATGQRGLPWLSLQLRPSAAVEDVAAAVHNVSAAGGWFASAGFRFPPARTPSSDETALGALQAAMAAGAVGDPAAAAAVAAVRALAPPPTVHLPLSDFVVPAAVMRAGSGEGAGGGGSAWCIVRGDTAVPAGDLDQMAFAPVKQRIRVGALGLRSLYVAFDLLQRRVGLAQRVHPPRVPPGSQDDDPDAATWAHQQCLPPAMAQCIGQQTFDGATNRCLPPDCTGSVLSGLDPVSQSCTTGWLTAGLLLAFAALLAGGAVATFGKRTVATGMAMAATVEAQR
jgi:hypothetical protein